jgi:O-methyltransferase
VRFIPGWFHESLPGPVERLAVLRLDGDQYIAQRAVLDHVYPLLSPGGLVIIDDYPGIEETRQAVDDYRAQHGITTEIRQAMAAGWWRKS